MKTPQDQFVGIYPVKRDFKLPTDKQRSYNFVLQIFIFEGEKKRKPRHPEKKKGPPVQGNTNNI